MMLMRTILNIPANSPKMLLNANVMGADVILFDLEDGVAPGQKPFARELLCAYLRRGLFQGQAMVRVNDVHTPYFLDDIAAVLPLPILRTQAARAAGGKPEREGERSRRRSRNHHLLHLFHLSFLRKFFCAGNFAPCTYTTAQTVRFVGNSVKFSEKIFCRLPRAQH